MDRLAPDLLCVTAPNGSPHTGPGTNSYLLGQGAERVLVDPGPDDPRHLAALLEALGPARLALIVVTHSHLDHSALAPRLSRATGAPVAAFGPSGSGLTRTASAPFGGGEGVDRGFRPDLLLPDGTAQSGDGWAFTALHTPGHMGNHIALVSGDQVFTGDTVMGWSSSLIWPPEGEMAPYMRSLRRLQGLGARLMLPGHGPVIEAPAARLSELIAHREARAAQSLAALSGQALATPALTARLYADLPPALRPAAEATTYAQLLALADSGTIRFLGPQTPATPCTAP